MMTEDTSTPTIYLLHGNDDYSMNEFISAEKKKVGDDSILTMNLTVLDEKRLDLDNLLLITSATPFFSAQRRLVIIHNPTLKIKTKEQQKKFIEQLDSIPTTTELVLVENRILGEKKNRDKNKWLLDYAFKSGGRIVINFFMLPKGMDLVRWIMTKAKEKGGTITHKAAYYLAELVDGNPNIAEQEIYKLLDYVEYERPIEIDDVELLTADVNQGDIFKFVDLLGSHNQRAAFDFLERLLEYQDETLLFGMVIRQFRLLLLAKELFDKGVGKQEITRKIKTHPYVVDKLQAQLKYFSMQSLEQIYHHLLDIDESVKMSESTIPLALESLVIVLSDPNHN
jgi:DNA polymerase III subunit delta